MKCTRGSIHEFCLSAARSESRIIGYMIELGINRTPTVGMITIHDDCRDMILVNQAVILKFSIDEGGGFDEDVFETIILIPDRKIQEKSSWHEKVVELEWPGGAIILDPGHKLALKESGDSAIISYTALGYVERGRVIDYISKIAINISGEDVVLTTSDLLPERYVVSRGGDQ